MDARDPSEKVREVSVVDASTVTNGDQLNETDEHQVSHVDKEGEMGML